jgi:predicted SAM-dependent methyltransferase
MALKVQFCSGGSQLAGWENRDIDCDITKPLPYGDNTVDEARIEHGIEHVTTHQAMRFLDEVHRILKPGGKFRLSVPVLTMLSREHGRDIIFGHGHLCAWSEQLAMSFLFIAGFTGCTIVGRDEGDHHWRVIGKEKDDLETFRCVGTK